MYYAKLDNLVGVASYMKFTEVESSVRRLASLLSDARRQRIADVVANRTGSLAILLENVLDRGNQNAVMRSMDAFGVHTLHILQYEKEPTVQKKSGRHQMRTDAGTREWIIQKKWHDVDKCIHSLKRSGFKIASTVPDADKHLTDLDLTQRLVIAFGNERNGLSNALLEHSDIHFSIPMAGFVQSLNLSVCVAVILHQAHVQRLAKLVRNINHV